MSAIRGSTLKQMMVQPPGGAEDTAMRADRVLGKMEMFVNDWLVQLGQGINPQWFISTKKGNEDIWKEGKMHGLSTKDIDLSTLEQSARVESQNRRSTSIITNLAYCASLLHSGITVTQLRQRGGEWVDPQNISEGSISVSSEWLHEVVVVETDASRLLEYQFFNKLPCIIVTGMGQPSEAVRVMVDSLQTSFNIPVYGAFDGWPYGLSVFLSYVAVMEANRDCSPNMMRWLGIRPLQLESLGLTSGMFQPFTQADRSCAKGLGNHPYVLKQPGFLREVEEWLREDAVKVELESLHSLGPNVLSTFLAESILQANYI